MRRVVITGVGAVSPCGLDTVSTWQALCAGQSGVERIGLFDATDYPSQIAGECRGFDAEKYIEKKRVREMDRFIHLAVAASQHAIEASGFAPSDEAKERVGTFIDPGLLASCKEEIELMDASAAKLGLTLVRIPYDAYKPDVDAGLKRAQDAKVQAVITAPITSRLDMTDKLALLSTKYRMPFMHDVPQLAGEALAVYGPDFEDIYRRAGHYVARILKGEKPAEMAIEEPRAFKFIVNAKVARALGIELTAAVRLRADEVIQ